MRALAAPVPFSTARENLLTFFARLGSKGLEPKGPPGEAEEVSDMLLAMCHVHGALFTREAPQPNPNPNPNPNQESFVAWLTPT